MQAREGRHPSILILIERLLVGGAERYFLTKARGMQARGCRVAIASGAGPLLTEVRSAHLPWIRLAQDLVVPSSLTPVNLIADAHHLAAAARALEVDVINCVAGVPFVLGMLLHDLTGIPVIFETLAPQAPIPPALAPALRRLARHCGVFAASAHDAYDQAAVADLPSEAIDVIPLPVDIERFRPQEVGAVRARLGLDPSLTVVVAAVRMFEEKAEYVAELIDVLAAQLPRQPELALVAAGDGPMRPALRQRAQAAGLRAYFPGYVVQMDDLYACADICVGNGLSALEASACGRPVVLAGWPPHEAQSLGYWGDDDWGCLGTPYPGSTWRGLDEALLPLLADREERRRRGELGRARVVERHGAEGVMDRWYDVYAGFARRGAPVRAGGAVR